MTITVANFITQYLRPALASSTDYPDATLGYWIDAALLDISRSFPRKAYAMWTATAGNPMYAYADSITVADETTIIRLVSCIYPFTIADYSGPPMSRKSHLDEDFLGGEYYDPDNDAQAVYIGATLTSGLYIYCEAQIYWKIVTATIINPSEHYELIRLFCIWQAYIHQTTDAASAAVPDSSLLSALALEARRAEIAYRAAYQKLDEAKATSGIAQGWTVDKWDRVEDGIGNIMGSDSSIHPRIKYP
jgi:hypothetical protein